MSGQLDWVIPGAQAVIADYKSAQTVTISRVGKRYAIIDRGNWTDRFDLTRVNAKNGGIVKSGEMFSPVLLHPESDHASEALAAQAARDAAVRVNRAADELSRHFNVNNAVTLRRAIDAYLTVKGYEVSP